MGDVRVVPAPDGRLGILEAIQRVAKNMRGIDKTIHIDPSTGRPSVKYAFRGIDEYAAELHKPFAEEGIITLPSVIERTHEVLVDEKVDENGNRYSRNAIHVLNLFEFCFVYAGDGSYVVASAEGQSIDYSDKAAPQAMTGAFKSVLNVLLFIETGDPLNEAESHDYEIGNRRSQTTTRPAARTQIQKQTYQPEGDLASKETQNEIWRLLGKIEPNRTKSGKLLSSVTQKAIGQVVFLKEMSEFDAQKVLLALAEMAGEGKAKSSDETSTVDDKIKKLRGILKWNNDDLLAFVEKQFGHTNLNEEEKGKLEVLLRERIDEADMFDASTSVADENELPY